MEIKKDLNDMYKDNFKTIEKKNYDKIIENTSTNEKVTKSKHKLIKKKRNNSIY